MRKTIIIFIGLLLSLSAAFAQKVGYLNSETVLAQIPEYTSAQQQLEGLGKQYSALLEKEAAKVDDAYKAYQADRTKLNEQQKKAREAQIIEMERDVNEKREAYFGEDGIMAKKSAELMDPVKKKMDEAIAKVAKGGGYSLIIDLAQLKTAVVYNDESYDLSMEVIKNLKQ